MLSSREDLRKFSVALSSTLVLGTYAAWGLLGFSEGLTLKGQVLIGSEQEEVRDGSVKGVREGSEEDDNGGRARGKEARS